MHPPRSVRSGPTRAAAWRNRPGSKVSNHLEARRDVHCGDGHPGKKTALPGDRGSGAPRHRPGIAQGLWFGLSLLSGSTLSADERRRPARRVGANGGGGGGVGGNWPEEKLRSGGVSASTPPSPELLRNARRRRAALSRDQRIRGSDRRGAPPFPSDRVRPGGPPDSLPATGGRAGLSADARDAAPVQGSRLALLPQAF